ncbi:Uncharacterized protein APZ42_026650 [Daphnia magna]|uniref:Uncharacterized protein n=1 Tax=Daphnia magna TaxID=35525 RepID=A0A164S2G2_9CRUS|nr:Uncharacterized protein APZ42_026650 [Daphnia magna]
MCITSNNLNYCDCMLYYIHKETKRLTAKKNINRQHNRLFFTWTIFIDIHICLFSFVIFLSLSYTLLDPQQSMFSFVLSPALLPSRNRHE